MASAQRDPSQPENRLDLAIALGSASQIALFVAPLLVLLSYVLGPSPMDLQYWPGAVSMMFIASSPHPWLRTAAVPLVLRRVLVLASISFLP